MVKSNYQSDKISQKHEELKLKYLDFMHVVVMHAVMYLAGLYKFAKENYGSLKPGIYAMEGIIKIVISSIYGKLHDIPLLTLLITKSSY